MEKIIMKLLFVVFLILFCILLIGCQYSNEPFQIISTSESLTLEWDSPQLDLFLESYKIYYRKDNASTWVLIDEIPSNENPRYKIYHSDLGNGFYDFAVRSVDKNGQESSLHTSRDQNADPINGWYLFWVISK